jgi:hypothetical protein
VILGGITGFADTLTLSTGPTTLGPSAFWIDQSRLNQNSPPEFQQWGQVITTPAGDNILQSVDFSVEFGGSLGTYFSIDLYQWSPSLLQPVGDVLFTSPRVLFAQLSQQNLDIWGVPITAFSVNRAVAANQQYVFEVLGDGIAGIELADATSSIQLYENSLAFGNYSFRSNVVFGAETPEQGTFVLFGSGALTIGGIARWRMRWL